VSQKIPRGFLTWLRSFNQFFTHLLYVPIYVRNDVDAMTASADEYAEKAKKTHQLTWIAKVCSQKACTWNSDG